MSAEAHHSHVAIMMPSDKRSVSAFGVVLATALCLAELDGGRCLLLPPRSSLDPGRCAFPPDLT